MAKEKLMPHDTKYKANELPHTVERELVVWYGIDGYRAGEIGFFDFAFKGDREKIILGKFRVKYDLPDFDQEAMVKKVVDQLVEEKKKIEADTFMKLKLLQDKIDSLRVIEHKK